MEEPSPTPSTRGVREDFAASTLKRILGENEIECHQMLGPTIFAFEFGGSARRYQHHGVSFLGLPVSPFSLASDMDYMSDREPSLRNTIIKNNYHRTETVPGT